MSCHLRRYGEIRKYQVASLRASDTEAMRLGAMAAARWNLGRSGDYAPLMENLRLSVSSRSLFPVG